MKSHSGRCAVIGAANVDIGGFPSGPLTGGDSNPGRIRVSPGGVGRNIALNLAQLQVETHLVTALGGDAFSGLIRASCESANVSLDHALTFPDEPSSAYLFIADANGDMQLAVNDMDICRHLTPAAIAPLIPWLNGLDAVVVDANLPPETLALLGEQVTAPLIADAVSAAKVERLKPILTGLWALKPNALEAAVLANTPVGDVAAAARVLGSLGLKRAFITLGERGVCLMEKGELRHLPGRPVAMVNATGAGDAFTAGVAWGLIQGLPLDAIARVAMAAAGLTVQCEGAVSPDLCPEAVMDLR